MKRLLITLSLLVACAAGFALPTLEAVQAEIKRGHYTQAEDMMREVVTAKPGSARAHYVYAELLAHDRRFRQAAEEAALARRLDPDLRFTQPEKFNAFTRLLEREQAAAKPVERTLLPLPGATVPAPVQARQAGDVPGWVLGVGCLAVLALLAWRVLGTSRQALAAAAPGASGLVPASAPAAPPAPGGSGLLGTGLAAAGGVAAGVLLEKWLEGRHEHEPVIEVRQEPGFATGFIDHDSSSDTAARELEQRPIDMGSGNGWDDGGSSSSSAGTNDDGW